MIPQTLAINLPTKKDIDRMSKIKKHSDTKSNSDTLRKALELAECLINLGEKKK